MKLIITILFVLLITPFISGTKITLSPSKIEFVGFVNETLCKNLTVSVNEPVPVEFVLNDNWIDNINYEKQITKYKLNSQDLDIKIDYPNNLIFLNSDKKIINVCLIATKPGNYNGAIILSSVYGNIAIGSWINLVILEKSKPKIIENVLNPNLKFIVVIQATFLFIILIFLYYIKPLTKNNQQIS